MWRALSVCLYMSRSLGRNFRARSHVEGESRFRSRATVHSVGTFQEQSMALRSLEIVKAFIH